MRKRIISLMLVLAMTVGMVPMLTDETHAFGTTHNTSNKTKCLLVPYAYRAMQLKKTDANFDPAAYFQAYKVIYYDHYDAKKINDKMAESSFTGIINAELESHWHALGFTVRQISSQLLDQDLEIEKVDIYNNLLINTLLDNSVEKITVSGIVKLIAKSISDFSEIKVTTPAGATMLFIDYMLDYRISEFAEFLYTCTKDPEQALEITEKILDGFSCSVDFIQLIDKAEKFVDNVLTKINPELTVGNIGDTLGTFDELCTAVDLVNEAYMLIANYLAIYDEVSNNVIPVLEEMHKSTDDSLLQEAIDKYIRIIGATSSVQLFIYIVKQIYDSAEEGLLKYIASKLKDYLCEKNSYYASAVLVYEILDIIGGIRDKAQYDLIIWYVNKYNVAFTQAMAKIQGYCASQKNNLSAEKYCKAYVHGVYMYLYLTEYEQELAIGYCKAWKKDQATIQAYENHLNFLKSDKGRVERLVNDNSLYAQCTALVQNGTTIKYIVDGSVFAEQNKPYNEKVNVISAIPTKTGSAFDGWRNSSVTYQPGEDISLFLKNSSFELNPCFCGSELSFQAKWTQQDTITYNANGGTGAPASHENTAGSTALSTKVPTRTGHTFLGWAESAAATTAAYQPGASYPKEGNVTLYAVWQAGVFDIVFHANGGAFADKSDSKTMQKTYLKKFTVSPEIPTRDGYAFSGYWTLNADGSGTEYKQGNTYSDIGSAGLSAKHLYAKWTKIRTHAEFRYDYSNSYDLVDSMIPLNNGVLSVNLVDPPQNILDKFAAAGKKFVKWMYIKPDGSIEYYESGDTLTVTNPAEPRECVYAVWEVTSSSGPLLSILTDKTSYQPGDTVTLTVTADNTGYFSADVSGNTGFKLKCADGSSASSGVFVEKSSASASNTLKCYDNGSAYSLKVYIPGSCADGSYTVKITASNGTYGVSGTETDTAVQTVAIVVSTAEEEAAKYTLSYDLNGGYGDIPASEYFEEGERVTVADDDDFARDGFTFEGWSEDYDGGGTKYSAGKRYSFDSNVHLYAVWEPIEGYGELDLRLSVERYSKVYKPGETAHVFVYPDYSNHFFFDARECSGFLIKNSAGNMVSNGTWFEKKSPNYDSSREGYTDGGMIAIYISIPSNCPDGQYTFFVTASNGVMDSTNNSVGDKVKQSATIYVRRSDKADSVVLSKTEMIIHKGDDERLEAVVEPQYIFNHYNPKEVKWSTNNKNVVSVDDNGNRADIEGVKAGTATVTASVDGVSASCQVTVVECSYTVKNPKSKYLVSEATCTSQATYHYLCECGDEGRATYKYGDLGDHTYSAWSVIRQPGETTAGVEQRTCSECQRTEERSIPATGTHTAHTPGAAWYSDSEKHWQLCSVEECTVKLGESAHTFGELTVEIPATETDTGIGHRSCSCGYVQTEIIPVVPHVHTWGTAYAADEENHWHICSGCAEIGEKTAHTWNGGVVVVPATETIPGIMMYTCTACSVTKNTSIPTLDHVHTWLDVWGKNADKHWHVCSGCDGIGDEADHIWDNGVVTKPATESETGIRTYTCTVCGAKKTETVYPPVVLSGTVKDGTAGGANSGKAISGVTVAFFTADGTSIGTAVTDAAGVYSFSFAQTGTYKCVFTKTGYKTVTASSLIINAETVSLGTVTMEEESRITAQGTIGRNGSWVLMSDGTLTVSGSVPDYGTVSKDTGDQPWAAYRNDIKKVVVSEGITKIGRYAFASCPNLKEAVIPGTVKTLGKGAFEGCTSLRSVVLPNSVSSIANDCFKNCSNLKAAYFYGAPPSTFGSDVFSGTASGFTIYHKKNIRGWSSPTWNGYPTATFVPGEEISSSYTVSGRITSFGTPAEITVELLQGDAVIRTVKVPAGSDTYTIADVPAGTYTLRISKAKHVTRTYTVVIQDP